MILDLVTKNPYIAYLALVGAILRVSRFMLEDTIFDPIRNKLLYRKLEQGHNVNKEGLQHEVTMEVPDHKTGHLTQVKSQQYYAQPKQPAVFLRKLFSCSWCLPVWVTAIMLPLTMIFPVPMGAINITLATAYIVSVLYYETA